MEIWKNLANYENYEVSDKGNVRSKVNKRILKPSDNGLGYLRVHLYKHNKGKLCYVHRLVAEAFLDNPNNLPEVNHINEDKTDNRVENLEYCNRRYNVNFGTRSKSASKSMKGVHINRNDLSKTVYQIDKDSDEIINVFPSTAEVERQLGYDAGCISKCCIGIQKTSYGYKWEYIIS